MCLGAIASTAVLLAWGVVDLFAEGPVLFMCNPPMFLLGGVILILNRLGWWEIRTWDGICKSFRQWNKS